MLLFLCFSIYFLHIDYNLLCHTTGIVLFTVSQNTVMNDSWFEDESEDHQHSNDESGLEIEYDDSETSEHEDEIDLDDVISKTSYTQNTFYSSSSGMTWSWISSYSTETYSANSTTVKSGRTELAEDLSSVVDAFQCFISEEILQKILIHSNSERTRNNTGNDSDEITIIELNAAIRLLLLAGLSGQSKRKP